MCISFWNSCQLAECQVIHALPFWPALAGIAVLLLAACTSATPSTIWFVLGLARWSWKMWKCSQWRWHAWHALKVTSGHVLVTSQLFPHLAVLAVLLCLDEVSREGFSRRPGCNREWQSSPGVPIAQPWQLWCHCCCTFSSALQSWTFSAKLEQSKGMMWLG